MFYFADSDDAADSVVGGEDRGAAFVRDKHHVELTAAERYI